MPAAVEPSTTPRRFVGVDVGATKTAIAVGSSDGSLRHQRVVPTVRGDPEGLADMVARTVTDVLRDDRDQPGSTVPIGIGIGICGGVGRDGWVDGPIALGWSERVDFAGLVAARAGAPTTIENDVNAGALAEHAWGAGRGLDDFMYLAIGTGVGAGLVLNGRLYRGARHLAGEIGHMSVDVDGAICACGNRGCIEATCGGKPASDLISDRLRTVEPPRSSSLQDVLARHGTVTTRDVYQHAQAGDAFALAEVDRMALYLSAAIVNAVNLLDLARVVVGGGQVQNPVLLPAILRRLRTWRPYLDRGKALVVPAGLGADAAVAGAVAVAMDAQPPAPQPAVAALGGGGRM